MNQASYAENFAVKGIKLLRTAKEGKEGKKGKEGKINIQRISDGKYVNAEGKFMSALLPMAGGVLNIGLLKKPEAQSLGQYQLIK